MSSKRRRGDAYPPLSDYAFISDCHSSALVSRAASIDWCCMPRFDRGSTFARLLDRDRGGHCSLTPAGSGRVAASRAYVDDTLVLETTLRQGGAEVRVTDLFAMRGPTDLDPHRQLIRVVDGVRGRMRLRLDVQPRFDYGGIRPWIRRESADVYGAIGGDDALAVWSDAQLEAGAHDLCAELTVGAGERVRVSLRYARPEELDRGDAPLAYEPEEVDRQINETVRAWRRWTRRARVHGQRAPSVLRSAIVLKGLSYPPTGAMAAAPTTSLPEAVGASRNWDYRFTWIRDSTYSVRTLAEIGVDAEADAFRRFIQRSAAGHVDDLQIVYGLGGERRIGEQEVSELEGYRGSGPVRVGNGASGQTQLDAYGEIVNLTWRWHCRGNSPDDDMWRFVLELCDAAAKRWREPDAGLWEWRGRPLHWTYSKAMCWSALDRGLALAEESMREAPVARWKRARGQIRTAVERDGYDARRGTFRQVFGRAGVDASLLLLPRTGIVAWDDERMVRTADAVRDQLGDDGLVRRYSLNDGMRGREGAFLACSFWLAECLARQDRVEEAHTAYDRAMAAGNDLGLFSEEFDTRRGEPCGNFPQALTHLAHIEAAQSLEQAEARQG